MDRKVFLYIEEQYERHGYPRHKEIMTEGRLVKESNLLRLEYFISPDDAPDQPTPASVMKVDQAWHVTRPSFGPELLTVHPRLLTQNEYAGKGRMAVMASDLSWEEHGEEGDVTVALRVAWEEHPYRPYSLTIHYVPQT